MDVIPIHSARDRRHRQGRRTSRVVPIDGTFPAPGAGTGCFAGWFRPDGVVLTAAGTAVTGVFAGELSEAAGKRIGLGSRRGQAPVRVTASPDHGSTIVVGPADVDLMGLRVHVREFSMHVGAVPRTGQDPLPQREDGPWLRTRGRAAPGSGSVQPLPVASVTRAVRGRP